MAAAVLMLYEWGRLAAVLSADRLTPRLTSRQSILFDIRILKAQV